MGFIDISRKSRNLKALIKQVRPLVVNNNKYIYAVRDKGKIYYIVSICKPMLRFKVNRRYDKLSGVIVTIREADITVCGEELFYIFWTGEYYMVRVNEFNNYIVKLVCSDECLTEGSF